MNRAVPAILIVLAAIVGIVLKAPPKVRENVSQYYKTLIQAPAAQMTEFTARTVRPRQPQKPAAPTPKPTPVSKDGPNVTVLGGVTWERKPRPSASLASHPEKPAEPVVDTVEEPQTPEPEPALATEQ